MTQDYISFTNYHVPRILDRSKYLTVRYGWEEIPQPGEIVDLVNGNREKFGEAEILWTTTMTMEEFVEQEFDGHVKYRDVEHMIKKMEIFYDDVLTPETEIIVISFNLIE